MAPRSTLVVFYIRRDGEVVADSITVNIQGVFKNKVTLINYVINNRAIGIINFEKPFLNFIVDTMN